jgi:peptide/nickel transport system permease protein
MLGRIHLFDKEGHFVGPFVYGIRPVQVVDPISGRVTPGKYSWEDDLIIKCPVRFFTQGEEYKFLGLFKTNTRFFGAREESRILPLDQQEESPCQFFPFGTTRLGMDVFSQTIMGSRVSMSIGPFVVLVAFFFGMLLGGISGFYGGATDTLIQRVVEVFMSLPRLALLLSLSLILSGNKVEPIMRYWGIVGLIALVSWAPLARVIRGQFLALREEEFVTAAKSVGAEDLRIIRRHILPNITSYLVVSATLTIPNVIILESVISFLGFGIRFPMVSWGSLLAAANRAADLELHPWFLIPAIFIVLTVLAFNFMGDALRDAVDPFTVTAKQREK